MSLSDKNKGAKILTDVFNTLKTSGVISAQSLAKLNQSLLTILGTDVPLMDKILNILAELEREKIRLPYSISLGLLKGLSIITNEKYAKVAGEKFVSDALAKSVRSQLLKGVIPAYLADIIDCSIFLTP
jgi:hypothetical protein